MSGRYFNWKLAVVLVIGIGVLAVTALGLRQWQRASRVETGLRLGNKAYDEHRWEEAAQQLGRYVAVRQDDVKALLKYSDAMLNIRPLKSSTVQQAAASYRIVLRVDPGNSEAARRLAQLYLMIGAPGEAELIVSKYLEKKQDPELQTLLAMSLARQRKFDEAAAQLKAIVTGHPEFILAYEALGRLSEQRPESFPGKPGRWSDDAVKNNPTSAMAYIIRAANYLRNSDRAKAIADLEYAEKLDLSDTDTRLRLAQEFADANAIDKAEEHLAVLQKTQSTNQTLWAMRAQLAIRSQSKEKMLNAAEAGLKELSSQPWDFMSVAAELFIRAGQFDRANDCISQLRQKDIDPATTAFLEGILADAKGQSYEAVKCWQRAMELGNTSPKLRLAVASALSSMGDVQSALWQVRTLVSEKPDLFDGHMALAKLASQTGNLAEAAEHAHRAVQLSPANPDAVLIQLQTRAQLQAFRSKDAYLTRQGNSISPEDREFDDQLAWLEKATNGDLKVKLLKFNMALQRGEYALAETMLAEFKKSYASDAEAAIAEVDLLTAREKTGEAISVLAQLVEKFPQSLSPVRYIAVLCARQGDYKRSEKIINDALVRIQQPAAQRELSLLLADVYAMNKKDGDAYKVLSELEQKQPRNVSVKRRLLACKQAGKDPLRSQQLVADIKSLEGTDGWQWRYEQARLWFGAADFKERYPQIVTLLKEVLLANPDDQSSRMLLATTYERSGELRLAVATYREALVRSPRDTRIIVPYISALYRANEYDQADEVLRQVAGEKIMSPELKKLELQSDLRRGRIDSASDILEELSASDPNNQSISVSLALLQMRQNKFSEAGAALAKLRTHDPNSALVMMAEIELNIRQGKPAEAVLLCDRILDRNRVAWAYILRSKAYAMLGRNTEAMESIENATVTEPNNSEAWVAKSNFYGSLSQLDKATDAIQKAMLLSPDNPQVRKRAVLLFLSSDNPDIARKGMDILDKAMQASPRDSELKIIKSRLLMTKGTAPALEQAKGLLNTVTKENPELSAAWLLLGELAMKDGRSGEAVDIASRGLIRQPDDRNLLQFKAYAEMAQAPSLAIPTLNALRELDANDVDTAVLLSNAYSVTGKPAKAVALLESQAVRCKTESDLRKVRVALAMAMSRNGDMAGAQEIFASLYKASPNDASVLLDEVRLLIDNKLWSQIAQKTDLWRKDHKQDTAAPVAVARMLSGVSDSEAKSAAERILRSVLEGDPECLDAMGSLGTLLQATGRSADAETFYQRILKVQPQNLIVINNLAWILCEERNKCQEALELSQEGLKLAPDYVDLIDTRGVAYYRLGQIDKAVQDFRKCIELYLPKTPSATASYFHLGRALAKLGQKDEAAQNLGRAIQMNSDIGGLSPADMAEAKLLVEQLSRSSDGKPGNASTP
jgi:tetratricopeptide (TPR) repeat protein